MKRVYIIHGWEADPDCNWFPWLKNELVKNGIEAHVPAMPNSAHPKCDEWIAHLKKVIGSPDEETILVGHSLGAAAILRYLESLPEKEKIKLAILVAGTDENPGFPELDSFTAGKLNYKKIKDSAGSFTVIHSDDDPVVPFAMGKNLADKLGAEFIRLSGLGHLNAGDGSFKFPLVLEKILAMTKYSN